MSIYSNDNIRKIAKLTTRELPQKSKNAKITVRENNGLYSSLKMPEKMCFQCIKSLKMGFCEEQKVWNQIKILNSHIPECWRRFDFALTHISHRPQSEYTQD